MVMGFNSWDEDEHAECGSNQWGWAGQTYEAARKANSLLLRVKEVLDQHYHPQCKAECPCNPEKGIPCSLNNLKQDLDRLLGPKPAPKPRKREFGPSGPGGSL